MRSGSRILISVKPKLLTNPLYPDVHILKQFAPRFQYGKIIEREYSKETLLKVRNIVSTLFLTETHYQDESDAVIDELVNIFEHEDDRRAAELLINWFRSWSNTNICPQRLKTNSRGHFTQPRR